MDISPEMKRRLLMAIFCQWDGDGKGSQVLTTSVSLKANRGIGQKNYNVQVSHFLRNRLASFSFFLPKAILGTTTVLVLW
jgi:hypothetical protein